MISTSLLENKAVPLKLKWPTPEFIPEDQMFCPKCGAEYREGFYVCGDCNVELVEEPPSEPNPEYIEYVEVLGTFNPADIAWIKSILDSESITYYFLGEQFTYVRPWADPARLRVKKDEAEEAKELLKDLKLSFMGINLEKDK